MIVSPPYEWRIPNPWRRKAWSYWCLWTKTLQKNHNLWQIGLQSAKQFPVEHSRQQHLSQWYPPPLLKAGPSAALRNLADACFSVEMHNLYERQKSLQDIADLYINIEIPPSSSSMIAAATPDFVKRLPRFLFNFELRGARGRRWCYGPTFSHGRLFFVNTCSSRPGDHIGDLNRDVFV